jgi:hypothetical protein
LSFVEEIRSRVLRHKVKATSKEQLLSKKERDASLKLLKALIGEQSWKKVLKVEADKGHTHLKLQIKLEEDHVRQFVHVVESLGFMSYYTKTGDYNIWVVTIDWKNR